MSETRSSVANIRITPSEEKELTERFGSPGKALRHSVNMIMADRKVRMPDAQFLIFPNGMVEVDSIVSAAPLPGRLLNPGEVHVPLVRVELHSGSYLDVAATYEEFLKELAKARMAD